MMARMSPEYTVWDHVQKHIYLGYRTPRSRSLVASCSTSKITKDIVAGVQIFFVGFPPRIRCSKTGKAKQKTVQELPLQPPVDALEAQGGPCMPPPRP